MDKKDHEIKVRCADGKVIVTHEDPRKEFEELNNEPVKDKATKLTMASKEVALHVEEIILKKLGTLFTRKRKEQKITVRELNKLSGVSLAVITDLENARSMPRVETLIRLGFALELDFNEIFETMKIPRDAESTNEQRTLLSDIATTIAGYGYNKNQVEEIIEFVKFIDYKYSNNK